MMFYPKNVAGPRSHFFLLASWIACHCLVELSATLTINDIHGKEHQPCYKIDRVLYETRRAADVNRPCEVLLAGTDVWRRNGGSKNYDIAGMALIVLKFCWRIKEKRTKVV